MKRVFYLAIIFFVSFLKNGVYAGEPPREPILRIETGMHTSVIKRIGVDAENRYLVTGSDDKTIRVWELKTGRLLRVLRPPIGKGNEGKIYSVAISPDGRLIVGGGWTGYEWDNTHSIYIFDRESGRLIKRIQGLPNVIFHLIFSKDGRYLVTCLGGNNGIRVYETEKFTLIMEDKDYGDNSHGADFDKEGRLVTTSYDGYIRLYDKDLTDEKATKDEILDGLEWLERQTTSKDVAIVFLAGHGVNDQSGLYYFLPVNANTEKLKRTGVAFSDIKNTVASLAGKTIMFVDTCHSGNIMGVRRGVADITGIVNELASAENGVVVFASSTGKQYSLEDPVWNNGAFTKALVEGISGKADYAGKGKITINMLDLYLSERVKELTKGRQTPTTTKPNTVPDFPLAVIEK